jgi:hypothetical protein
VICSGCGTENRVGAKFCMECATPFAVAALEGRRFDAASGYREALRGWHGLGLAFDEASPFG